MYLALGDSITYGHNAATRRTPFPLQVQAILSQSQSTQVELNLIAKAGWTSDQLLQSLSRKWSQLGKEPTLVTLIIGGNDILKYTLPLLAGKTSCMHSAVDRLCHTILKIGNFLHHPNTTLVLGTLYNPFPNWRVMDSVIPLINQNIRRLSELMNVRLLDLEQLFKENETNWIDGYRRGRFLDLRPIGNPIHPNLAGHLAIANEIVCLYHKDRSSKERMPAPPGLLLTGV